MERFLVGGAVRDSLLGRPIHDRDWVFVGATPEDIRELEAQGFQKVGADFPVWLSPAGEEHALARCEKKTGCGYYGFTVTTQDVSLIADLERRDLTINAMARTADGTLIDPFHGVSDLQRHILRHVSPAFADDPVRVLRVARFAAELGFAVAPETCQLMRRMAQTGELDALTPERVWKEIAKALQSPHADRFITVLADASAFSRLFPGFDPTGSAQAVADASPTAQSRFIFWMASAPRSAMTRFFDSYSVPRTWRTAASTAAALLHTIRTTGVTPDTIATTVIRGHLVWPWVHDLLHQYVPPYAPVFDDVWTATQHIDWASIMAVTPPAQRGAARQNAVAQIAATALAFFSP